MGRLSGGRGSEYSTGMTHELRVASVGLAPEAVSRVALAARLATLDEVVRFGFAQRPAWQLIDVIVQDEYTHDVIVGGPAAVFVVFDTT